MDSFFLSLSFIIQVEISAHLSLNKIHIYISNISIKGTHFVKRLNKIWKQMI